MEIKKLKYEQTIHEKNISLKINFFMKLGIVGGRDFNNFELLCKSISDNNLKPSMIISGGAKGADTLAEKFANQFKIPKQIFYADWDNLKKKPIKIKHNEFGKPYNALAGFNRNKLIVDTADIILAFWNGKSTGTKNTIDYAKEKQKQIIIIKY